LRQTLRRTTRRAFRHENHLEKFPATPYTHSHINPIQIPSEDGTKIKVLGIPMVIRIHGRVTVGAGAVVESHDVDGCGPPPQVHHREDGTFQVLEGEYEWTVGAEKFVARKGATTFAPRTSYGAPFRRASPKT
jgi:mannose-6-phosphate isomerase-like protein (cupin superfamily)